MQLVRLDNAAGGLICCVQRCRCGCAIARPIITPARLSICVAVCAAGRLARCGRSRDMVVGKFSRKIRSRHHYSRGMRAPVGAAPAARQVLKKINGQNAFDWQPLRSVTRSVSAACPRRPSAGHCRCGLWPRLAAGRRAWCPCRVGTESNHLCHQSPRGLLRL